MTTSTFFCFGRGWEEAEGKAVAGAANEAGVDGRPAVVLEIAIEATATEVFGCCCRCAWAVSLFANIAVIIWAGVRDAGSSGSLDDAPAVAAAEAVAAGVAVDATDGTFAATGVVADGADVAAVDVCTVRATGAGVEAGLAAAADIAARAALLDPDAGEDPPAAFNACLALIAARALAAGLIPVSTGFPPVVEVDAAADVDIAAGAGAGVAAVAPADFAADEGGADAGAATVVLDADD